MEKENYHMRRYYYPKKLVEIARKRVAGLLHASRLSTTPLCVLIESAYLQGIIDGYQCNGIEIPFESEDNMPNCNTERIERRREGC